MHENQKEITISGRNFIIDKFDALTGCYIAYQIMSQMLPAGMDGKVSGMMPGGMPEGRKIMSENDFKTLMRKCLCVCFEVLPGAKSPVMRSDGGWGVMNIEKDMAIVLTLVINTIVFNVQGFFAGDALTDLKASLKDIKLFNAPTSTNSSTPR